MNVSGCQGRKRMTATLSQGQGIWLFIAPVFPLSTGDNPFILRIRRSPLAPRFRHQSIITLLMLFPSMTFKSLKAGSQQPRFLKAEIPRMLPDSTTHNNDTVGVDYFLLRALLCDLGNVTIDPPS